MELIENLRSPGQYLAYFVCIIVLLCIVLFNASKCIFRKILNMGDRDEMIIWKYNDATVSSEQEDLFTAKAALEPSSQVYSSPAKACRQPKQQKVHQSSFLRCKEL